MNTRTKSVFIKYQDIKIKILCRDSIVRERLINDWALYLTGYLSECDVLVVIRSRRPLALRPPNLLLRGKSYFFSLGWRRKHFNFLQGVTGFESNFNRRVLWVFGLDKNKIQEIVFLYLQSVIGEKLDFTGQHRIHATACIIEGKAIVVPLNSNEGKSTFAYWAMRQTNLKFLSDETIFTDGQSGFGLATRISLRNTQGIDPNDVYGVYVRENQSPKYLVRWPHKRIVAGSIPLFLWLPKNKCSRQNFFLKFIFGYGSTQMFEFMFRLDSLLPLIKIFLGRIRCGLRLLRRISSRELWQNSAAENYEFMRTFSSFPAGLAAEEVKTLDLVMITRGRVRQLRDCLNSILQASQKINVQKIKIKLLIGINGEDLESLRLIEHYSIKNDLNIKYYKLSRALPGVARNYLIKKSKADWLFFIDDDIILPDDIFIHWQHLLASHPRIDVFGGPNLAPKNSNSFQIMQSLVLGSFFGAGIFRGRYVKLQDGEIRDSSRFTLCNLFFKKIRDDLYFPAFICGEETDLLRRLHLYRFFYSAALFVYHERRANMKQFADQIFKYGVGRGENFNIYIKAVLRSAFAVFIFLFVIYFKYFLLASALYFFVIWANSMSMVLKNKLNFKDICVVFGLHVVLHFYYFKGIASQLLPDWFGLRANSLRLVGFINE